MTDKFNINLNQNLWGLIVTLITLGTAEYYKLNILFWFGLILSTIASLSFIATLIKYTIIYVRKPPKYRPL